jgi:hypothetical protein
MRYRLEIENIEELRLREGIDDVELREAVAQLRVGDHVRLTFLAGPEGAARETLLVQVTRIRKTDFLGRLTSRPTRGGLAALRVGARIAFAAGQVHSIAAPRQRSKGGAD